MPPGGSLNMTCCIDLGGGIGCCCGKGMGGLREGWIACGFIFIEADLEGGKGECGCDQILF